MPEPNGDTPASFLVVEDNENIRKLYATLIRFKYSGVATAFAENGQEGLEACKKQEPTLILADIRMPVMNGIEFHRQLKERSPHLADRVAFVSATFKKPHLDYMRNNNCAFLKKPFKKEAFSELINSMLIKERDQNLYI